MIVGMIMLMTFGLVDTFFVSLLGTEQLAAISFTFPVTFTLISLNIGLGIGTSACIARFLGAGQHSHAQKYATGALMLSALMVGGLAIVGWLLMEPIFGLLGADHSQMIHIRDYMNIWFAAGVFLAMPMVGNSVLRAAGDTKTPSKLMAASGLINAVLDPVFIFGLGPLPAMGIKGAALATFIAWGCSFIYIMHLLIVKRQLALPRLLNLGEFITTSKTLLKIGLPAAGANMLTPLAGGVLTAVVAEFGPEAVAMWGVGNRLESIASIVILALSMTLPPFISQNLGANKIHRAQQAYQISIRFVLIWQLAVFALLAFTAPVIASVFAKEQQVAHLIQTFLYIVPLGYGLQGVIILTNSSFNAMHKPMSALTLSVIRLFVLFVPLSYIGSVIWQLHGMFWAGILANIVTATLAYWWFSKAIQQTTHSEESV
ncbi:MATE family efflux transporter [Neptunicella marina]|uniref:MATE family efflux transporter n=2 Tax=Neptunicella marina TaxID=2125989 RepID=A0A8J6LZU5_9ALTE|nr:MATE family efflux transporter [Neptunicella marina]MBC3766809.1 MATE family efflux transporter [Neptunicella marina]